MTDPTPPAPPSRGVGRFFRRAADKMASASLVLSYAAPGYRLRKKLWDEGDWRDMTGRHVLITGGNSGIGFATADALAGRGATVTIVCRNPEKGADALARLEAAHPGARVALRRCDLSDLTEVATLCRDILRDESPLHVLVNNAGVLLNEATISPDGYETSVATNLLAGHLLTATLWPRLSQSGEGRIVNVSSGGMYSQKLSVEKLEALTLGWAAAFEEGRTSDFDGTKTYALAKRAQVILTEMWAARLGDEAVTVNAMHPGWAATPGVASSLPTFDKLLSGILRDAEQGADTVAWLAAAESVAGTSGAFFFDREARPTHLLPWTRESSEARDALWAFADRLTGTGAEPSR